MNSALRNFSQQRNQVEKKDPLATDIVPKGYKQGQISNYTPEMIDLFRNLFSYLGPESDLGRLAGGDESYFEEMEAPAHRMFQEQIGGIGSRYSGMGMGGKGSAFQNESSQAAQDFAMKLQSNRQGLRQQALRELMEMSQMLLNQRPVDKFLAPKQQDESWASIFGKLGGPGAGLLSSAFGGGSTKDAFRGGFEGMGKAIGALGSLGI